MEVMEVLSIKLKFQYAVEKVNSTESPVEQAAV